MVSHHPPHTGEVHGVDRHPLHLRRRPDTRHDLYAGRNLLPAGREHGRHVQPRTHARGCPHIGLRDQGGQHSVDIRSRRRPRPRPALAAHVGELRRGLLPQCRNGTRGRARISGRRPQPCRRQPCRSLHEALHGLRRSGQRQGPHTVVDNRSGHAREALRALSRNGKGGSSRLWSTRR